MRVNVTGSILCAAEAVRRMSVKHGGKGGAIVNMSSMAADHRLGRRQYVDYAASKGAIDTFTIGLSREVATRASASMRSGPAVIDTEIHASGGLPDRARELAPTIPMQRPGTAQRGGGRRSLSSLSFGILCDGRHSQCQRRTIGGNGSIVPEEALSVLVSDSRLPARRAMK